MRMKVRIGLVLVSTGTLAGVFVGCKGSGDNASSAAPATPTATAPKIPPPAAHDEHVLHNIHKIDDTLISGAAPEGDAAFDELRAMGVKTIISVDGATPDVARAEARGIRYVHIPITYAEVSDEQRLHLARAVRDLPGPVFIHCHHGKHRSPAATAAVAITLNRITPEQGTAFLKTAGTAPNYTGLYSCVAAATPVASSTLDGVPADYPAISRPDGIVAAMVEIDVAFEQLGEIRAAGWKPPTHHPDLVPAAEAGRLVDLLRVSHNDPRMAPHGDAFVKMLDKAVGIASAMEEAIVANAPEADLDGHYKLVQASCKECHAAYRDKP